LFLAVKRESAVRLIYPQACPAPYPFSRLRSYDRMVTTSLHALSSAVPIDNTFVDDLSPGARRLYDLLVGGSSSPTPAASPRAPSSASTTSGIPKSAAAATALPEMARRTSAP
jgi:hypothetical protein